MFKTSNRPLALYSSMGRLTEDFVPRDPRRVRLYTCGPTVYNYAHIGNLRAYIFTDTLRRALAWKGYPVFHLMNITDVGHLTSDADEGEDKMEVAAQKEARSIWEIAEFYTQKFQSDLETLNIWPPSFWSKATDHIQEMIDFAQILEDRGFTYLLDSGLYFDTTLVKDYGKLALLNVEGQKEGARVDTVSGKRNPTDFALWRNSPADKQRLMEWDSPWGKGAPGWHLECSCMSLKYLDRDFDIHTGGVDHRQVHHCNEIAQNQAYLGSDDSGVRCWMHNEFLIFGEEKMSKSTGDFLRLDNLADRGIHPLVYRYFNLSANYRSPLEFSWEALRSAKRGFSRLLGRIRTLKEEAGESKDWPRLIREFKFHRGAPATVLFRRVGEGFGDDAWNWLENVDRGISDDLNTPKVLALLSQLVSSDQFEADVTLRLLALSDLILGLELMNLTEGEIDIKPAETAIEKPEIEKRIEERNEARRKKDFATADRLRDDLLEAGVVIKDSPEGTTWNWASAE